MRTAKSALSEVYDKNTVFGESSLALRPYFTRLSLRMDRTERLSVRSEDGRALERVLRAQEGVSLAATTAPSVGRLRAQTRRQEHEL
jgi:hypothetical protein